MANPLRRFGHAVWYWTDKLLPVAFWIGSVCTFWIGFTLWQETRDNETRTEAIVIELAEEVQRSLVTDCELGNQRNEGIIRFWDLLVRTFVDPENQDDEESLEEFRARLVADFPSQDCDLPPLIE